MLRITKLSDYGTAIMALMVSFEASQPRSAREIAEKLGLTFPMVSKILKVLVQKGLVTSHRGVRGGYYLSRPAREISLAEIVRALDGPICITPCSDVRGNCGRTSTCPGHLIWPQVNLRIQQVLESISLAHVAMVNASPFTSAASLAGQVVDSGSLQSATCGGSITPPPLAGSRSEPRCFDSPQLPSPSGRPLAPLTSAASLAGQVVDSGSPPARRTA